jgi:hypothetical protein
MPSVRSSALAPALLVLFGCAPATVPTAAPTPSTEAAFRGEPHAAFLVNLALHCGGAYPGRLVVAPPGDRMLTGTERLVVHFRRCAPDRLELPFHIEREADGSWDRSRTWVFMRLPDGIELRHDHRHEDGTPDETTWYGGRTESPGTPGRQEFVFTERRAADGSALGWRVEIVPGERYSYGTIRGTEWTWRVDFDLRTRVPPPPAPWGHEGTPAGG